MRNFDYSILAKRSWDSEIIGLVAQIHEYKGRQELYMKQKPAELAEYGKIRTKVFELYPLGHIPTVENLEKSITTLR